MYRDALIARPKAGIRFATLLAVLAASGLGTGCSRNSAADPAMSGAQPAPRRTTQQAAETIRNSPDLSPADKEKYLRQLKENEMAERMNPNAGASNNLGPTPRP